MKYIYILVILLSFFIVNHSIVRKSEIGPYAPNTSEFNNLYQPYLKGLSGQKISLLPNIKAYQANRIGFSQFVHKKTANN